MRADSNALPPRVTIIGNWMSDIGILNSPLDIAFLLNLFGGLGLGVGAVIGGLTGAILSFAISIVGWLYFSDNL